MLYAIVGEDRPDSLAARLQARPAHIERLKALQEQGRLILADADPYMVSSVYIRVTVKPFNKALPA